MPLTVKPHLTLAKRTLEHASKPVKAGKEVNFSGLHNLAKHAIYLRENCESAVATVESLRVHHRSVIGTGPNPWEESTQNALEYRKSMFQSTLRRLSSLDSRMANIMQLSFHLVTQLDSRNGQSQNQSMKAIAVITIYFMPLGTVASIFGSQFFQLKDDEPHHMQVSQDFWLLWLIAVPLTALVILIWRVWYQDRRDRLIGPVPPRSKGKHGYMGWRRLKHKVEWTESGPNGASSMA